MMTAVELVGGPLDGTIITVPTIAYMLQFQQVGEYDWFTNEGPKVTAVIYQLIINDDGYPSKTDSGEYKYRYAGFLDS